MAKQQDTNTSKSRVIGICVAVVMAALVGVIVYLLVTRTTGIKEEPRNVVVTQNNVEKVLDNLDYDTLRKAADMIEEAKNRHQRLKNFLQEMGW